ncbi:MAG: hypothetical protein EBQ92_13675, partial [Proteobacteria bacterium]|nr:hypothetical protein [Pseudomonadota bacterium]
GVLYFGTGDGATANSIKNRLEISAASGVVFNQQQQDVDFRVATVNYAHGLFVDASTNRVGINNSAPGNTLTMSIPTPATLGSGSDGIIISNTAGTGYNTQLVRLGASYNYSGATGAPTVGAGMLYNYGGRFFFVGDGASASDFVFTTYGANRLQVGSDSYALVVNEDGADYDFRVESDTNTHALFVDAGASVVCINSSSGVTGRILTVGGNGASIAVVDTNAGIYFGSTATGFYVNPAIARASTAGFHISSSQVGDLCIGGENGAGIRFGTASGGGALNNRMYIDSAGAVTIVGSLSKGSGSFCIDHPLPEKTDTHQLVHSFIEGPQADLIYRGKVALVNGRATVNIDQAAGMTEGTFVVLCRDIQCFTSNESDWDAVRGSVSGNILTIECQNSSSSAVVSWMVIGERQDPHMYDTDWTDENGRVIVEPVKLQPEPVAQ